MARTNLAEFHGFKLGRGDVHQNVAFVQIQGVFADAGIVFKQGLKPGAGRDVQLGAGAVINLAQWGNAMAGLKEFDRLDDIGVEDVGSFHEHFFNGQVAFGHEALAQGYDQFALYVLFELDLANAGPAAAGDEFLIELDGAFESADRAGCHHGGFLAVSQEFGFRRKLSGYGQFGGDRGD